jgi:hypothetical protein
MGRASVDALQSYHQKWTVQSKRITWTVEMFIPRKRARNAETTKEVTKNGNQNDSDGIHA